MFWLSFVWQPQFVCKSTTKFIILYYKYLSMPVVLNGGGVGRGSDFVLQKTFSNIWRHFWLSQLCREVIQLFGWRSGVLQSSYNTCTVPVQRRIWPQKPVELRLRNSDLHICLSSKLSSSSALYLGLMHSRHSSFIKRMSVFHLFCLLSEDHSTEADS